MEQPVLEPYVPQMGFVYPDKPDDRMVPMEIIHNITIDEHYPFLDKTFKFRLRRFGIYLGIVTIVRWMSFFRFGLKIEGRENLRKHRALLKNGAMTISNHVHRWDFPFVAIAVRYRTMYFPVWKEILNSKDLNFIRGAGGIPIPDHIQAIKFFNKAFDELHARKKWIHAYPESSRFDYFQPIRPFKKGVFTIAYRYNLPVIPMAYSYRAPAFPVTLTNNIRSKMGLQQYPMLTLRIGEPILIDESLGRKEAVQKLRKDCHKAVVRLAGIRDTPFPAEGD
jgi:1-acyl-sn-glycerol-3-phosphate acyltransferase